MTAEPVAALVLAYAMIALLVFYGETIWDAIVFFMDWTLRQITRPFDWLFRRYWP